MTEKLARRAFTTGAIGFVFIGVLHTVTHAAELSGPMLSDRFQAMGDIRVSGQTVSSWDLFQGTSLLMGAFSIGIGLLDLAILAANRRAVRPLVGAAFVNMAVLAVVITVGMLHLGPLQVFGGLFGLAVFGYAAIVGLTGDAAPIGDQTL